MQRKGVQRAPWSTPIHRAERSAEPAPPTSRTASGWCPCRADCCPCNFRRTPCSHWSTGTEASTTWRRPRTSSAIGLEARSWQPEIGMFVCRGRGGRVPPRHGDRAGSVVRQRERRGLARRRPTCGLCRREDLLVADAPTPTKVTVEVPTGRNAKNAQPLTRRLLGQRGRPADLHVHVRQDRSGRVGDFSPRSSPRTPSTPRPEARAASRLGPASFRH